MQKKLLGSICLVFGIIIIVTTGTTYAYFQTSVTSGNDITGEVTEFKVNLNITEVYKSTNMVPLKDNLVKTAITNSSKCRDKDNYEVCSLYKLKLTNTGQTFALNGYLKTSSTTYTTGNLKYQIYDTSYTAITDVMTPSLTIDEKVYFSKNNTNVTTNINTSNIEYYLVMWISDTNSIQTSDHSKTYSGAVGFETTSGDRIEADI